MQNSTIRIQYDSEFSQRRDSRKSSHLQLVTNQASSLDDAEYGPDLGEFEEQYLLGYACFA